MHVKPIPTKGMRVPSIVMTNIKEGELHRDIKGNEEYDI